jgi:hypothetical protein
MSVLAAQFARTTGPMFLTGILMIGLLSAMAMKAQQEGPTTRVMIGNHVTQQLSGFYCNLKALSPEERVRQRELSQAIALAKLETKELQDGYAFRLQETKVSVTDLAEWVAAERKCCPFFDFEISLGREGGALWLKLRGADGVKDFMRHELHIQ